jgi:alkaline phosphatase
MKKLTRVLPVMLAALIAFALLSPAFAANESDTVKNVIIMIGDGMGVNHLEMAKQELGINLSMDEDFPIKGFSQTRSFDNEVTDSAAGGTALSCGIRTANGFVGVFPLEDPLKIFSVPTSITEAAMADGKRTGVVTTDKLTGATPATFSAHTYSRGNSRIIASQQMSSGIDLLWGTKNDCFNTVTASIYGFEYFETISEMESLGNGSKSLGQFSDDCWSRTPESETTPTLEAMTASAISILDNEDNGFFLMVEGAHIDKHSHKQNVENMVDSLYSFDDAVKVAVDFAKQDGNTVVIVTADHETGGITLVGDKYEFTMGSHSGADVPLLVYGSDDIISDGETIKNKDVPLLASRVLGIEDLFTQNGRGLISGFFFRIYLFFSNLFKLVLKITPLG